MYQSTRLKNLSLSLLFFAIALTFGLGCVSEDGNLVMPPTPVPNVAETNPAISSDGKQMAFYGAFDSIGNVAPGIYISDSDGKNKRPTGVFGTTVVWLPGDSELIINTGIFAGGELVSYNLDSHEVSPLGIETFRLVFAISSDGKFLYYVGSPIDSTYSSGIYRYSLEGGIVEAIVGGDSPSISKDGSILVFSRSTICYFLFPDSSQICFGFNGRNPIWTHDDQSIVYNNSRGEIYIADLSGNSRHLVDGEGAMDISSNGQSVLFARVAEDFQIHIWRINLDGTGLQQITQ